MVQNIWIRGKELVNAIGLLCGGIAIIIVGFQISNQIIQILGIISSYLFILFLLSIIIVSIRDIYFHPKDFWVGLPWR